jgi:thymidylate kinase
VQINLLSTSLAKRGIRSLILRGDGSRPGFGDCEGDPYSPWWQNFKQYVKECTNEYDAWCVGARRLMGEAASRIAEQKNPQKTVILFDRARISRAQMTLKEGLPLSFETMYRNVGHDNYNDSELKNLRPNITIYLHAPATVLLGRLSLQDPKYDFRRENIITSQESFDHAFDALRERGETVVSARADQDPVEAMTVIRNAIMTHNIV